MKLAGDPRSEYRQLLSLLLLLLVGEEEEEGTLTPPEVVEVRPGTLIPKFCRSSYPMGSIFLHTRCRQAGRGARATMKKAPPFARDELRKTVLPKRQLCPTYIVQIILLRVGWRIIVRLVAQTSVVRLYSCPMKCEVVSTTIVGVLLKPSCR